jgi:GTPase SAR1 family protein
VHVKIMSFGGTRVGKTAAVAQYVNENVPATYRLTIGLDFPSKRIGWGGWDINVTLEIRDTAGQESSKAFKNGTPIAPAPRAISQGATCLSCC